ncbi:MAG TPA: adenylate/guanylate cyclase domain-containing protein [Egibacteraceae bacterium]|nr:adenylate/guanylate cyclase domain-containing protein [Egibacteraceae bacterium]
MHHDDARPTSGPGGERPFGLRVLGRAGEPGWALRLRVQTLLTGAVVVANLVGAAAVVALSVWLIPGPSLLDTRFGTVVVVAAPAYIVLAVAAGALSGTRRELPRLRWVAEGGAPPGDGHSQVLRAPFRLLGLQVALWLGAVVLFGALGVPAGWRVVLRTTTTVLLGGLVTCTCSYLLSELALRPLAARVLALPGAPERGAPGLAVRSLLVWLVGTGVPVLGLMVVAVVALVEGDVPAGSLAITMLGLGGVTLAVSLLLVRLGIQGTLDPLRSMRRALAAVEAGRLDTRIVVYDASELGRLQAGFNRMVAGLEERERLRDLFGRHVGEPVATAAVAGRFDAGGEVRDAAVVFVDIVGSTRLAAELPPERIVELLNRFFTVVVDVVDRHGGLVNKFVGDAALAVFGVPTPLDDACGRALAAARELAGRLPAEVPECPAGIGVAAGRVVAGNVGDQRRFEFTVIGDPVNEAARLTELAKSAPSRLLASAVALDAAGEAERGHWELVGEVTVEGRATPTRLAAPRPPG